MLPTYLCHDRINIPWYQARVKQPNIASSPDSGSQNPHRSILGIIVSSASESQCSQRIAALRIMASFDTTQQLLDMILQRDEEIRGLRADLRRLQAEEDLEIQQYREQVRELRSKYVGALSKGKRVYRRLLDLRRGLTLSRRSLSRL